MKVRVIKPFRDKHTKELHTYGEELTISEERLEEINSTPKGVFVVEIAESKEEKDPEEEELGEETPPGEKEAEEHKEGETEVRDSEGGEIQEEALPLKAAEEAAPQVEKEGEAKKSAKTSKQSKAPKGADKA